MYYVILTKKSVFFPLNSIANLVFIMDRDSVLYDVGTKFLYAI